MFKKVLFFGLCFIIFLVLTFSVESKIKNTNFFQEQIIVLNADIANFLLAHSEKQDDLILNNILKDISSKSDTSLVVIFNSLRTEINKTGFSLINYFGNLGANDDAIGNKIIEITDKAIENSISTLTKRLEHSGIKNPVVYKTGSTRISVELPSGLSEEMKTIIQTTGILSFNLCKDFSVSEKLLQDMDKVLFEKEPQSGKNQFSTYFNEEFSKSFDVLIADENDLDKIEKLILSEEVKAVFPNDIAMRRSNEVIKTTDNRRFRKLYLVKKEPELTGQVITNATLAIDKNADMPYVSLEMNEVGAKEWERITGANLDKKCAIIFDGIVYSAPVIKSKILGGKTWIQGMATMEETKILSILLKSGALEIPLKIIE